MSPVPPSPDRIIAIDWSGDKGPGQKKKIWAAIWTRNPKGRVLAPSGEAGTVTLETNRTRAELAERLITLALQTPALVVGIDCCFSYPAWFLREHRCPTVFDFWQHVNAGHGERWLGTLPLEGERAERDARFWGKPHKRPAQFSGEGYATMMRRTDMENKVEQSLPGGDPERAALMRGIQPKSPFQIGGSGSVGTGSLRAMPILARLHEAGFRVWPFENASLTTRKPAPLLVEIYTRLLTGPVAKSNPEARRSYLLRRARAEPTLYGALPRAVLAGARSSEDGFDALVCLLEMLRHQTTFAPLRATQDPTLKLEGITWRPGV